MRTTQLLSACLAAASLPSQSLHVASEAPRAVMAYDEARDRLAFLQQDGNVVEFDGATWAIVRPEPSADVRTAVWYPPLGKIVGPDAGNLVAYDGHGFEVIAPLPWGNVTPQLMVDRAGSALLALEGPRLWRWDGVAWQQQTQLPTGNLSVRAGFDEQRGAAVVVALTVPSATWVTWEWDGSSWTLAASGHPFTGGFAFDPIGRRLIATFGGTTRAWTGTSWVGLSTPSSPSWASTMASDFRNGEVWSFERPTAASASLQVFDGSTWHDVTLPQPDVGFPGMSFDAARDRVVLLGDDPYQGAIHAEWDGVRWNYLPTASGPLRRTGHAQVYDAARQRTVVFGGYLFGQSTTISNDTWLWDGLSWQRVTGQAPPPRYSTSMAYDSARQRVVLIGGQDGSQQFDDHWEWDGASWTQIATSTPAGPIETSMGYDEARSRIVVLDLNGVTHEYDGTTWQTNPVPGPMSIRLPLTWDGTRQRLTGDAGGSTGLPLRRYEYDGAVWTAVGDPLGVYAYDPIRAALLVYGLGGDTRFALATALPSAATSYGAPCGGQSIATSLTAFGSATPGNTAFQLDLRAEATLRPALVAFGTGQTQVPIGNGCALLVQNAFASRLWFTDAYGVLHVPLPMPGAFSLRGYSFTAQAGVLDPASPGGIALSQGLTLVVGD